jgi:hypothetical protein
MLDEQSPPLPSVQFILRARGVGATTSPIQDSHRQTETLLDQALLGLRSGQFGDCIRLIE